MIVFVNLSKVQKNGKDTTLCSFMTQLRFRNSIDNKSKASWEPAAIPFHLLEPNDKKAILWSIRLCV